MKKDNFAEKSRNAKVESTNTSPALMTPQARYDAKTAVHVPLKLNRKTDPDIIQWLDRQQNRQGAIKSAIRAHISAVSSPAFAESAGPFASDAD